MIREDRSHPGYRTRSYSLGSGIGSHWMALAMVPELARNRVALVPDRGL